MKKCEVCGYDNLESVLNMGNHPLCDDLVPIGNDRICIEYPIHILYCNKCYTAFQAKEVPKRTLFTESYHYRARMTGSVLTGMQDLVQSTVERLGDISGKFVLDIGCNDGSLLNFFEEKGCKTLGIEPTGAALESSHETLNTFFDFESASLVKEKYGSPDIITFTNVFAHIENLPELLDNLAILIGKNTNIVIENHYLGDILKRDQFDTFYHEHPRTYSLRSFEFIAKSLGLSLLDAQFVSRYGGNIRVFLGKGVSNSAPKYDESVFLNEFIEMRKNIETWKNTTKAWISDYVKENGKIRAKAFPGRAAIMIKLLDLNDEYISAVYEIKGSIKVGHYVPGTRIPILPEVELYALDNQDLPILNLAWHIPNEVCANLVSNGYTGKVVHIKNFD